MFGLSGKTEWFNVIVNKIYVFFKLLKIININNDKSKEIKT